VLTEFVSETVPGLGNAKIDIHDLALVYTEAEMAGPLPQVVWDDENLHHLLVERAARGITCEEVEDVLIGPDTTIASAKYGRRLAIGKTEPGRPLAVIFVGDLERRPYTAWQIPEQRWRQSHDN